LQRTVFSLRVENFVVYDSFVPIVVNIFVVNMALSHLLNKYCQQLLKSILLENKKAFLGRRPICKHKNIL